MITKLHTISLFYFKLLLLTSFGVMVTCVLYAQDIEGIGSSLKKIKEAKPVKVTGGINAGSGFYGITGMPSRRAPFTWAVNGNLNISVYEKVNIPLSINYTDNGTAYSAENPLKKIVADIVNRTGISPKYKSITLHLGDRSMTFSKYTYAGLRFFGAGIEWAPKNGLIKYSGFYGRFNRRTVRDTINGVMIAPAYERMGWGSKLEFGKERHKYGIILFKAKDQTYDGDILTTTFGLTPQENLVFGMDTKHKFGKKISINFEYTASAYSLDARSNPFESSGNYNYFNNLGGMFTPGMSTIYNNAYNGSIQFTEKYYTLGLTYLWVDPTYKSLGAIAAKNDIQATTVNSTVTLFKGKVLLGGNVGTERNNLANNMALTMKRIIYAGNVTYNAFENFALTGTYSNFNHSTSPQMITKADSIKLVQINHNTSVAANYSFGKNNLKHAVMAAGTFQNVQDIKEIFNQQLMTPNEVTNYLGNYSLTINDIQLTSAVSMMYNKVDAAGIVVTSVGPSLNVSKKLLQKKLNLSFVSTYLANEEALAKFAVTNYKLGAQYKQGKHHALKAEIALVNKHITKGEGESFKEFLGKLSYDFNF